MHDISLITTIALALSAAVMALGPGIGSTRIPACFSWSTSSHSTWTVRPGLFRRATASAAATTATRASTTAAGAAGRGAHAAAREAHPGYQAVAVAASVIPCASSQRSASIAALQPSAAAVTAGSASTRSA